MSLYSNLDFDNEKISQPLNLKIDLMEHQKTIVKAMLTLESEGFVDVNNLTYFINKPTNYRVSTTVGILGDKMGSGKSFMIISLLLSRNTKLRDNIYESSKYLSISEKSNNNNIDTNILIIPHKLVNQWLEFFKFAPDIKVCYKDIDDIDLSDDFNVILIPETKYEMFETKFLNQKFNRIIIDEADSIKLPKKINISSNFLWLVTGTPSGILYANRPYLNDIFNKNKSWILDYITVKNKKEYIDASIVLPKMNRYFINCLTPKELKIIDGLIPKNIVGLINSGNTDEAIRLLNYNEDSQDNIVNILTKNIIQSIENKKIEIEAELKKKSSKEDQHKKISIINKSIERLNERLSAIKKRIYDLNDEMCPVCMGDFEKPCVVKCCRNVFCFECLTLSLSVNDNCPFCRKTLKSKDIHMITEKNKIKIIKMNQTKEIK
jgi:hypothetical protein